MGGLCSGCDDEARVWCLSSKQRSVHRDIRSRPIGLERERWGVIRSAAHVSPEVFLIFSNNKFPLKVATHRQLSQYLDI